VQALTHGAIGISGAGLQTRSFCFVDDLIDAFIGFMNTDGGVGPMNLGNPGEFTIKELAEQVIRLTNSKSELSFKDLPTDDPLQRCPDITQARAVLGWEPKVALEEGLKKTIPYFASLGRP